MKFMYGLECEYPLDETADILEYYQPVDTLLDGGSPWVQLSFEEKINWLTNGFKTLKDKEKALVLRNNHSVLPKYLVKDDTGNLELVFSPVKKKHELVQQINFLKKNFGLGLLQGTLSLESDDFFTTTPNFYLGWFQYFTERDFLEKLFFNYKKWDLNPHKKVGYFLFEPFLGLATSNKINRLRKLLKYQSMGEWWEKERLDFLSRNASSSKYVGSTVYRPDLAGPERICLEVRDAHRNSDLLLRRLARTERFLQENLEHFDQFTSAKSFEPEEDFSKLPEDIQKLLTHLIPISYPASVAGFRNVEVVYEVYRIFAYPLRNWDSWIKALGGGAVDLKVLLAARNKYLRSLTIISNAFTAGTLERQAAIDKIIVCLLKFAVESPLMGMFLNWEEKYYSLKNNSNAKYEHTFQREHCGPRN